MRPTLLDHRPPDERTAEHNVDVVTTNTGHHLNICDDKHTNPKGYSLPQAPRFGLMNFHDKGTGQSIFTSSNSYNAGAQAAKLLASPAPTIVVSLSNFNSIFSETYITLPRPRVWFSTLDHGWPPTEV